jgi:anthranilate phosphoribosyltransferase
MIFDEAYKEFQKLFNNEMSEDEARSFLIALYERGESFEEIAAATKVMREHSIKLDIPSELKANIIDVVGTGGDKSGSFNVSSTVSLILASMGVKIAKHGNRAITSNSGSADMLEKLGINLNLTPQNQVKMLEECGFTFMFAVNHHPAMKYIMPLRKSIPHRTIFNILGPLTNPAGAMKYLVGVFSTEYIERIAKALSQLDTQNSMVMSSRDGMDEISICDVSEYYRIKDGKISSGVIDPRDYGFTLANPKEIQGGNADENVKITRDLLKEKQKGAKRDIVLLNGAAALVVDGKARDIKEGIEICEEAIDSGKAWEKVQEIIKVSNSL